MIQTFRPFTRPLPRRLPFGASPPLFGRVWTMIIFDSSIMQHARCVARSAMVLKLSHVQALLAANSVRTIRMALRLRWTPPSCRPPYTYSLHRCSFRKFPTTTRAPAFYGTKIGLSGLPQPLRGKWPPNGQLRTQSQGRLISHLVTQPRHSTH